MTVQAAFAGGKRYDVAGGGYSPDGAITTGDLPASVSGDSALAACLRAGLLCGDGDVRLRDGTWEPVGDPMEAALVVAARKAGLERAAALREQPRASVLPFESERRYTASVHRQPDGTSVLYVKGAVEQVLAMCDRQLGGPSGVQALHRCGVQAAADEFGRQGQRVLAFAIRSPAPDEEADLERPRGLAFAGLQALVDPPRPEAIAAVRACRQAGIAGRGRTP